MHKLWTIAILTIDERERFYERLRGVLDPQLDGKSVDVIVIKDNRTLSIGEKRQYAVDHCTSEYIAFIDDDDLISANYVDAILNKLKHRPYGVGFRGIMTGTHSYPMEFIHKAGLPYAEKPTKYNGSYIWTRPLNHLNPVMIDIAKHIGYKSINEGEDYDYAKRLDESGLIADQTFIDQFLYFYQFRGKNKI